MPFGVKIPVEVVGGEAATRDLKKVGDATAAVGQAAGQSAGAQQAAGGAAQEAARGLGDFDNKSEKLVKTLLGGINPQLANTADLLFDAIEGSKGLSTSLLTVGAVGAGIGAVVLAVQQLVGAATAAREEVERIAGVQRELREARLGAREKLAEDLLAAGVNPSATQELFRGTFQRPEADGRTLAERIGADRARQVAVARGLGLRPEDESAFVAGITAGGGAKFGTDQKKNAEALAQAIQRGRDEALQAATAAFFEEQRDRFGREAAELAGRDSDVARDNLRARIDTEIERLRAARPDLDDDEVARIRGRLQRDIGRQDIAPLFTLDQIERNTAINDPALISATLRDRVVNSPLGVPFGTGGRFNVSVTNVNTQNVGIQPTLSPELYESGSY